MESVKSYKIVLVIPRLPSFYRPHSEENSPQLVYEMFGKLCYYGNADSPVPICFPPSFHDGHKKTPFVETLLH